MDENFSAKKRSRPSKDLQDYKVIINFIPISKEEREERRQTIANILVKAAFRYFEKKKDDLTHN